MKFITLKTYDNSVDAHLLKSKLESEGIVCYLKDEFITNAYQQYSYPFGGVKLMVRNIDFDNACSILCLIEDNAFIDKENIDLKCPNCNSTKITSKYKFNNSFKGILSLLSSLLIALVIIKPKSVYKCNNCNSKFEISN
jgi:DNA-directed RNA polymerase subunit RPC12/RpoP